MVKITAFIFAKHLGVLKCKNVNHPPVFAPFSTLSLVLSKLRTKTDFIWEAPIGLQ